MRYGRYRLIAEQGMIYFWLVSGGKLIPDDAARAELFPRKPGAAADPRQGNITEVRRISQDPDVA